MRTVVTTEKMCCYYTENIYQTSSTQQSNLNIPTHQSNAHSSIYDSMMCLNPAPLQQWVGPGFSQNRMRSGLDAPSGALTLVWGESDDPMQVDRETNRLMAFWETPQCRRFALILMLPFKGLTRDLHTKEVSQLRACIPVPSIQPQN